MKKNTHSRRTRSLRSALSWLLTLVMLATLFPAALTSAGAAEPADDGGKENWEIALENKMLHFDTIDLCGGSSHMQGICVDDDMKYMYFSYTDVLVKMDMETGKVVATVGGFGEGSFTAVGGAHIGCLAYHDGKIYSSLEYKEPGKKFFIAVFDEDAITEIGQDMNTMESGVYGILLDEPTKDFRDPLNDEEEIKKTNNTEDGTAVNEQNLGHAFACSGIDGVTFGTMPGDDSGKIYMFVAYGIYRWADRYDNNYNVIQVYDPDKFDSTDDPVLLRFTYDRGFNYEYDEKEALVADKTLYVWTSTTNYGSQNLEADKDTGDIVLYTYDTTKEWAPGYTLYVVDASKAPVEREIEVGQSNTVEDAETHAKIIAKAEAYKNGDGTYPKGLHAVLKNINNNGVEQVWGDTGFSAFISGGKQPKSSTTGICSIGGGYYYITDGSFTVSLYHRDENYNFTKVQRFSDVPASEWYASAVEYAAEHGLVGGVDASTFNPAGLTTRGMMATLLYNLEGKPTAGEPDFPDVSADAWYAAPVAWAAANHIISGYSDGKFGPEDIITREQLATMLYNYEKQKGGGFKGDWAFQLDFPDADSVSDWAYEAVCWCSMKGIISGTEAGTLNPGGSASRAEVAAILTNYCKLPAE